MPTFRCDNCRKEKDVSERGTISFPAKIGCMMETGDGQNQFVLNALGTSPYLGGSLLYLFLAF